MTPPSVASRSDEYNSDAEDVPPSPPAHRSSPPRFATPTARSPDNMTASSSSSDEDSDAAQHASHVAAAAARASSEAAALKTTGWLLLRSTARNLTNVVRNAGVTGLRVEQLYDFNPRPSSILPRAFILLYKWAPDRGDRREWNPEHHVDPDRLNDKDAGRIDESHRTSCPHLLFCNQTMDNASATQALILALLNIPETLPSSRHMYQGESYDIGDNLRVLKAFLKPLDPVMRAAAISSSTLVRDSHNQAARNQLNGHPELLDEDGKVRTSVLAEELWMYSVFLPAKRFRAVYEMDGMADGAERLAVCGGDNWGDFEIEIVDSINSRIVALQQHHTPFLLFAVGNANDLEQEDYPRVPRHGRPEKAERENGRGARRDWQEDGSTNHAVNDSREAAKEEYERIAATHDYENFFVEMLKLMASKGEINNLISSQDPSDVL